MCVARWIRYDANWTWYLHRTLNKMWRKLGFCNAPKACATHITRIWYLCTHDMRRTPFYVRCKLHYCVVLTFMRRKWGDANRPFSTSEYIYKILKNYGGLQSLSHSSHSWLLTLPPPFIVFFSRLTPLVLFFSRLLLTPLVLFLNRLTPFVFFFFTRLTPLVFFFSCLTPQVLPGVADLSPKQMWRKIDAEMESSFGAFRVVFPRGSSMIIKRVTANSSLRSESTKWKRSTLVFVEDYWFFFLFLILIFFSS